MSFLDPSVNLSSRHYAVSGNAADAARQAGYSERSARQTGCALLERPYNVERLRRIRQSSKRTERNEACILLARLEQARDAAVASGSAYLMLRVLRLQAEIAGLTRPAAMRRARACAALRELGGAGTPRGFRPGHACPRRRQARRGRGGADAPFYFDIARAWSYLAGEGRARRWLSCGATGSVRFMAKVSIGHVAYSESFQGRPCRAAGAACPRQDETAVVNGRGAAP